MHFGFRRLINPPPQRSCEFLNRPAATSTLALAYSPPLTNPTSCVPHHCQENTPLPKKSAKKKPSMEACAGTLLPAILRAVVRQCETQSALRSRCGRVPRAGDPHVLADEPTTVFHSRTLPPASLESLIECLMKITKKPAEVMVMALVLVARYSEAPSCTMPATLHMLHRLFLSALLVALKAHDDAYYDNAGFCRFFDLSVAEMCRLERAFVAGLDWRLWVQDEDVWALCDRLRVPCDLHEEEEESSATMDDTLPSADGASSPGSPSPLSPPRRRGHVDPQSYDGGHRGSLSSSACSTASSSSTTIDESDDLK